jgi:hypothetical protein
MLTLEKYDVSEAGTVCIFNQGSRRASNLLGPLEKKPLDGDRYICLTGKQRRTYFPCGDIDTELASETLHVCKQAILITCILTMENVLVELRISAFMGKLQLPFAYLIDNSRMLSTRLWNIA